MRGDENESSTGDRFWNQNQNNEPREVGDYAGADDKVEAESDEDAFWAESLWPDEEVAKLEAFLRDEIASGSNDVEIEQEANRYAFGRIQLIQVVRRLIGKEKPIEQELKN